ncbi:hypothetical protein A5784_37135 [Mycobacterium sp. 852013-50091_SCH5140682]|uniref:SRPBCC family protein n=1 Tax=Mycobacterium sp. 852013-50091_SCH5140682 TaxID=1834109 RepID=UPI0007EB862E|nr:hypothetical protein A5784_37135 [Mycobacterium sp. 852013-50091_SCH5140682]
MAKARRSFEGSTRSSASASQVWDVWTDPPRWPGGIIESASIDREFGLGARITVKGKGGPATASTVTQVESPRLWTGTSSFPGLTMRFEHQIDPVPDGTILTERVIMAGPLAGVAAMFIGPRLATAFVSSTGRIAEIAERP